MSGSNTDAGSMVTPLEDRIVFEDNHILVVNKLPSEIVQGDKTGDIPLIENVKYYLKAKYNKPGNVFAGLVHRIDRPVSGIVIFAKTSKALARLNDLIKNREIKKKYLAIVRNNPPASEGSLEHFLLKNEQQNKSYVCTAETKGAKKARLDYKLLAASSSYHLLEIDLHTGRHHQIRTQLATIGCPIVGDLKYGDKRSLPNASIALHASAVSLVHPVNKTELHCIAPPPDTPPWIYFSF